jgi:hypothetical protein
MTIQLSSARRAVSTTLLVLAMAAAHSAAAAPTASGKSFDVNISVSLLGIPVFAVTPQDQVEFANLVVAYQDSEEHPNFHLGDQTTVYFSTDDLSAETQWIPGANFLAVGSRATAANVDLSVLNPDTMLDANASLLDLSATQVQATAAVTGSCPVTTSAKSLRKTQDTDIVDDYVFVNQFEIQNLSPTNTTNIPGLQIDIDGNSILNIPANPLPNTSVNIGAIGTLMLNKQTVTGDGVASLATTVDGLLLDVDLNIAAISLLHADVNLAHSEASITCN